MNQVASAPRFRFGLRAQLALLALLLLGLPWMGYRYVQEMERFLVDGQRQALVATARAVATALHERPGLMALRPQALPESTALLLPGEELVEAAPTVLAPLETPRPVPEVEAILRGLERTTSRIQVINRDLQLVAQAGSLASPSDPDGAAGSALWRLWRKLLERVLSAPAAAESSGEPHDARAEVFEALMGGEASRVRRLDSPPIVVVAAAHPVWSGDRVLGVVRVEESTQSIASLRNQAVERLIMLTLGGFVVAALLVLAFASRLSSRIRRLRDEAEHAVDGRGRVRQRVSASRAGDEIGDLSRSFQALLARLDQHHAYLESMANRLSHELRTPIAVVRSSLENLRMEVGDASAQTYLDRADAGLSRLSRILTRMSEATRMEQALASAELERFDLAAVVAECINGYRVAYPARDFESRLPPYPVYVRGVPDLAAQMLDKLVENAADFATPGTPIRIDLGFQTTTATLSVSNTGPLLPAELEGRLFESMVSARPRGAAGDPHLGLGLYVARMIARFHGGKLQADNLPDGSGVCFGAQLRLSSSV
ncbi:MAG TPA: ATP-binding protein [Rhodocyclaceae bacterium]|nr:ATP-binding protein [Rhodocyclaceae bacterium]